jgi:hypothetical protein
VDVERFWLPWMDLTERVGVRAAYAEAASDYPPLGFLWLRLVAIGAAGLSLSHLAALKLGLWCLLSASSAAVYVTTRRASLALLLYTALLIDSVGLVYLDVLFVPTLLLASWAFDRQRWALGALLYTLTCFLKFQPLVIGPVVGLYLWRSKAMTLRVMAAPALIAALVLLTWGDDVVAALARAGNHRALSAQALNAGWIMTVAVNLAVLQNPPSDIQLILTPSVLALALRLGFAGLYLWVLFRSSLNTFDQFIGTASLAYLTYFTFSIGAHENHLVVLVVLLAIRSLLGHGIWEFAAAAIALNLNLALFYGVNGLAIESPALSLARLVVAVMVTAATIVLMRAVPPVSP